MGGHDPYSSSKGASELVTSAYRRSFFSDPTAAARLGARRQRDRRRRLGRGPADPRRHARRASPASRSAIRNPRRDAPVAARAQPAQRLPRARPARCADDPDAATAWNFGPAEGDARPVGWIVERLDELWPGGLRWEHDAGAHPHEARYLEARLLARARAARLGAALGPRARRSRAIVEWYAALRDGARHARGHARRRSTPSRRRWLAPTMTRPAASARAPLEAVFADLGMSPLANSYLPPEQRQRDGAVLSAARARLRRSASSCSSRSSSRRSDLLRLRLLLVVLVDAGSSTRARYVDAMIERFGLGADEPGRRDRVQRRLPAAVLRRSAASRCSASSRRPTSPRSRSRRASRRSSSSSGVETARAARGRAQRRPAARQQRARPRARPQRLRRRHEGAAQAGRRDHDGVPAPAAADRATNQFDTIYHEHFSYLSFLDRRGASSRRTGCGCSTSRSCRRTAARCASTAATPTTRAKPETDRARASCSSASDAAGLRRRSRPTALRRARRSEDKRADPRVPDRAQARRASAIAGYGAPAKGNTLLNYCGIGTDFLDYTVDLNPHKQGHFLPGTHIPIRAPEAHRARRSPTSC